MPLSVCEWTCDCGARHDRDVNAARNILTLSTTVNAGSDAREVSKNLSAHDAGAHEEARTDTPKITEADRMDRAA